MKGILNSTSRLILFLVVTGVIVLNYLKIEINDTLAMIAGGIITHYFKSTQPVKDDKKD